MEPWRWFIFLQPAVKKKYPYLSKLLYDGILILLYLATLRLHFFHPTPLLSDKTVGLVAILLLLAWLLKISVVKKRQALATLVLTLFYVTAVISDDAPSLLAFTTIAAALTVVLLWQRNWPWMGLISFDADLSHPDHVVVQ